MDQANLGDSFETCSKTVGDWGTRGGNNGALISPLLRLESHPLLSSSSLALHCLACKYVMHIDTQKLIIT